MALTDSIEAYWKLDETSGTRYDETPNNNDLTDNNTVAYAAGIISNGADFEATNSEYLSITDAAQTGLDVTTSDISFSFWVYPESVTGNHYLINKVTSQNGGYKIAPAPDGKIYCGWYNTSGNVNGTITPASTFVTGAWQHYVITMDVSEGGPGVLIYKNGSLVGSTTSWGNSGGTPGNTTEKFALGCANPDTTPTAFFDGIMDEVGVWSRVLTSDEVTSLYNGGSGLTYPFTTPSGPANLKTWNGVAKASLKTYNGIAIASLKSWNGIV